MWSTTLFFLINYSFFFDQFDMWSTTLRDLFWDFLYFGPGTDQIFLFEFDTNFGLQIHGKTYFKKKKKCDYIEFF